MAFKISISIEVLEPKRRDAIIDAIADLFDEH